MKLEVSIWSQGCVVISLIKPLFGMIGRARCCNEKVFVSQGWHVSNQINIKNLGCHTARPLIVFQS